jgi:hypothetical protein
MQTAAPSRARSTSTASSSSSVRPWPPYRSGLPNPTHAHTHTHTHLSHDSHGPPLAAAVQVYGASSVVGYGVYVGLVGLAFLIVKSLNHYTHQLLSGEAATSTAQPQAGPGEAVAARGTNAPAFSPWSALRSRLGRGATQPPAPDAASGDADATLGGIPLATINNNSNSINTDRSGTPSSSTIMATSASPSAAAPIAAAAAAAATAAASTTGSASVVEDAPLEARAAELAATLSPETVAAARAVGTALALRRAAHADDSSPGAVHSFVDEDGQVQYYTFRAQEGAAGADGDGDSSDDEGNPAHMASLWAQLVDAHGAVNTDALAILMAAGVIPAPPSEPPAAAAGAPAPSTAAAAAAATAAVGGPSLASMRTQPSFSVSSRSLLGPWGRARRGTAPTSSSTTAAPAAAAAAAAAATPGTAEPRRPLWPPRGLTRPQLELLLDRTLSWAEVVFAAALAAGVAAATYPLFALLQAPVAVFFLCIPIAAYVRREAVLEIEVVCVCVRVCVTD